MEIEFYSFPNYCVIFHRIDEPDAIEHYWYDKLSDAKHHMNLFKAVNKNAKRKYSKIEILDDSKNIIISKIEF